MSDLVQRLRDCAADPMWADHCEISKRTVIVAADELDRLRAELASSKLDAERYRWLRRWKIDSYLVCGSDEELDAAIDGAMK